MESNAIAVIPPQELREIANAACKSGLFPMPNPESAFMLMLICQSEGLHPVQALKRYHVIKGRPTMRSDAMQAEFQRAGGKIEWIERTDKTVKAKFSHASGGTVEVEWTIEMARNAGLSSKDVWKQFPRQMLTARVISEGVRTILPGIVTGIYTPEEIQDLGGIDIEDATIMADKPKTIGQAIAESNDGKPEAPKKTTKPAEPKTKPAATETKTPDSDAKTVFTCSACGRVSDNPGACKCAEGKTEAKTTATASTTAPAGQPTRAEMMKEITSLRAQKRIQTEDWKTILASVEVKDANAASWTEEAMFKVLQATRAKGA